MFLHDYLLACEISTVRTQTLLRRKNMNPNDYVHCCVIGCIGNSLLHFGLNTKVSCDGLLEGGGVFLKHLYLNGYAEFDSKISYLMFFNDYHLACQISTVRIHVLTNKPFI